MCLLGLLGAKTLRGRRPAQSSPARLHQVTFTLSRLPTARCSRYLAPPPAFVPPAPRQPECGWRAGQLRALAGRRPCAGGEGGTPRRCPRSGGARGDRGDAAGSRASVQAIRAGDRRGTGDCPTFPEERKGPPPRAVPLNTDLPTLRLPTAGSHRTRPQKSFATPKVTLKKVFLGPSLPLHQPRVKENSRK